MTSPTSFSHAETLPLPHRELRGVVERITFANPDSGYTVARLAPERGHTEARSASDERLVTLVGELPELVPGEAIIARGWWRQHPKHCWQFHARDYHTTLPATLQGMKRYLGSGLVRGIGPINAGRIVDTFGDETFNVIEESPERLEEVPGIGPIRAWSHRRNLGRAAPDPGGHDRIAELRRLDLAGGQDLPAVPGRAHPGAGKKTLPAGA